jgi:hypothetical protein
MSDIVFLTKDDLKALVVKEYYHRIPDSTVTVCALTLKNGFIVVGDSACIDPRKFDEEIGRQVAFDDAIEKVWELEGYRMKSEGLFNQEQQ